MSPAPIGLGGIGQSEYSEQLMRALEIKGDLPGELLQQYIAQFLLEDFANKPEYGWLRRESRWSGLQGPSAVAAQYSGVALMQNAVFNRNVLCVVEEIWINNPNAGNAVFRIGLTWLGFPFAVSAAVYQQRDDRQGNTAQPAFGMASGSQAAAFITGAASSWYSLIAIPAGQSVQIKLPFILTQKVSTAGFGSTLIVQPDAVNLAVHVTFHWRERGLLPAEQ